ncbi:hypothetical protein [Antiquaquibacter soli]|uniref:Polysaccharide biosynthesis protein n=1 Tax=Antiquaquibacter soli TaxID=3064523 RepID=A0ABT9BMK9_9MICO|nr:hypothetical protein [Protaetiibacter sp. WY-16]MDO7881021.1 hypothetical protein [Protaetiibacter sp. WY-16]
MRRLLGPIGLLGVAAFSGPILSLIAVPVIISRVGPEDWSALAVGQSVGSLAAIPVALGFAVTGTVRVARLPEAEQAALARQSMAARLIAGPVLILLAAVVAALIVTEHAIAAGLAAVAVSGVGLDLGWFFIGQGRPLRLLLWDTTPKAAGTLLGIAAVLLGAGVLGFAAAQVLGTATAVVGSALRAQRGAARQSARWSPRGVLADSRRQGYALGVAASTSAYLSVPTVLVAILLPDATALFALIERISRSFGLAVTPVLQWLQQSTRLDGDVARQVSRFRSRALLFALGYGVLAALVAPLALTVLSAGTVSAHPLVFGLLGLTVAASAVGRLVGGVILQHLDRVRRLFAATLTGAAVAAVTVPLGILLAGLDGAVVAVAAAELAVATGVLSGSGRPRREDDVTGAADATS